MKIRHYVLFSILLSLVGCAHPSLKPHAQLNGLARLKMDARAVAPLVHSAAAHQFVAAVDKLPSVSPRKLYRDKQKPSYFADAHYYSEHEVANLDQAARAKLEPFVANDDVYYNSRYGGAYSYARPLDLLADAGVVLERGARLLDFGYGYVAHMRLLAEMGVEATGVDVEPMLRPLYAEPGDQGAIGPGQLKLVTGHFPADSSIVEQVGGNFDVIISKNTLKKGYIHPDRPAPANKQIYLGAADEVVLARFFTALKPGGKMLIYNICPAPTPPDKPFVPWSDGRSPYSAEQWQQAGFRVLVFNRDDTATLRRLAHAMKWDEGEDKQDLEHNLSVIYTLVERPAVSAASIASP